MAERFLYVFEAHGIEVSEIPRFIAQIKYQDLQAPSSLMAALTPAMIDATAELLGVRRQWLEGSDDLVLYPFGRRGNPDDMLNRLRSAVSASMDHGFFDRFPLRVLTTSKALSREPGEHSTLLPVIVEPIGDLGDRSVYRCHVFGDSYDWSHTPSRLELKAITWLLSHRLNAIVPLFQVSEEELDDIRSGMAIPSMVWRKGLVTDPSLEDFVLTFEESGVAQETDELPAVLNYLDTHGLLDFTFRATSPVPVTASSEPAPQEASTATPVAPKGKPPSTGKRQAQQAHWSAILTAAQTVWAKPPCISYADMIRRLKSMPHLKASALSNSAIHKQLHKIAPPEVRGKPGRKPNQSA